MNIEISDDAKGDSDSVSATVGIHTADATGEVNVTIVGSGGNESEARERLSEKIKDAIHFLK